MTTNDHRMGYPPAADPLFAASPAEAWPLGVPARVEQERQRLHDTFVAALRAAPWPKRTVDPRCMTLGDAATLRIPLAPGEVTMRHVMREREGVARATDWRGRPLALTFHATGGMGGRGASPEAGEASRTAIRN